MKGTDCLSYGREQACVRVRGACVWVKEGGKEGVYGGVRCHHNESRLPPTCRGARAPCVVCVRGAGVGMFVYVCVCVCVCVCMCVLYV